MSKQIQSQEEEIDLGGFFNQIGKLFSKLFGLIGFILKSIYHFVIITLIFAKKHYWKLGIALLAGLLLGYIGEKNLSKKYYYEMTVEPKYDGVYFLKNRASFYNQLVDNKDYNQLMKIFKIDLDDAKSILEFELESVQDEKDLVEGYDNFVKNSDTTTVKEVPLKTYVDKKFSKYNYKNYMFRMTLSKSSLKKNVQNELLADLENNVVLQKLKNESIKISEEKEKNLLQLMQNIDSIISKDKMIALTAAKNSVNTNSSIELSSSNNTKNKDFELLQLYKNSIYDLSNITREKIDISYIYKVISPFEPMGKYNKSFFKSTIFIITFLMLFITVLWILFQPFLLYLDKYKK